MNLPERLTRGPGRKAVGAIVNVGSIVTGDIDKPESSADTILIKDGIIHEVGSWDRLPTLEPGSYVLDAQGQQVAPGLIDSHVHPVVGDWAPKLNVIGWLRSYGHAGVTTVLSQGSWIDGYPRDAQGMVAVAIALQRHFVAARLELKVHGSSVSIVEGLERSHFEQLAAEGIWLIAEIGVRSLTDVSAIREILHVARDFGFVSRVHFGPESVPGTSTITAQAAVAIGADIASHVNGGPTSPPLEQIDYLMDNAACWLELSPTGNHHSLLHTVRRAKERGSAHRLILGTDTPTGFGVLPRALLQTVALVASSGGYSGAQAFSMATGNTARAYGLNTGLIAPGREADLLIIDAPVGSRAHSATEAVESGDIPAVAMVVVDGTFADPPYVNSIPGKRGVQVTPMDEVGRSQSAGDPFDDHA